MYEHTYPKKRFQLTLEFVKKHIPFHKSILDLGVSNPLSHLLQENGYEVSNTHGEDLDEDLNAILNANSQAVTAFEILEHLNNPYTLLKSIQARELLVSVPLKLWFSKAYQSKTDPLDRHYHEFEIWQLEALLEKTGWIIKDQITFTHPVKKIGFRPLLRLFTPRYCLVYAQRK